MQLIVIIDKNAYIEADNYSDFKTRLKVKVKLL